VYVDGFGWLTGRDVHEVEKPILEDLEKKGIFFRLEPYRHRYPHCWRCREKLVFRVEKEWFIRCDEIRPLMKAEAAKVQWIPESVGKRCQDWYNNMGDWCISRKRYWGLPLPFYFCPEDHLTIIGSRTELRERAIAPEKVDSLPELHRPWIDEVRIRCGECGAEATRILDVGDCWLDAGIVAYSTLKYHEDRAYWEKWFPAELVCEMREQVRLWFYSMMFMSVTLEGRSPYKRVFAYEKVHDEQNRAMHRSHGNAVWFDDVVEQMGADVMRWLYCAWNPSYNLRFGLNIADDMRRKLLTLWNVYGFFVTYAELDKFDPGAARIEETLGQSPNPLDRWILSALNGLVGTFRGRLDEYDVAGALRAADGFLEGLSTWYVRRSRRRFWKSEADEDKQFAYRTLHHVLTTTARLLAPIVPFLGDEIWRNLTAPQRQNGDGAVPESVHLTDYPEAATELVDEELNRRVEDVLRIVSLGRAAREKVQIKVRQPLSTLWIVPLVGKQVDLGESLLRDIAEELNVKQVRTDRAAAEVGEATVKLNFPVLGRRLGGAMKEVQAAAKQGHWEQLPGGRLRVGDREVEPAEFELVYQPRPGVALAHDHGLMVALETEISEELLLEGYARELIRRIQELRKQADYQVDDRITLRWDDAHPMTLEVLERHGATIAAETLAKEVQRGKGPVDRESTVKLGRDRSVWIGVHR
jgi:isoleucyl-tRNA synthetase